MQNFFSSTENSQLALSNLLSQLSYIKPDDIRHAQQLASATGLPLGKCFVLLDCLSQDELLHVLEAQALLMDGVISMPQLVKAMESVRRGWTLVDALTMLGLDAHSTRRTRLGELLTDAGAINQKRLSCALRIGEFSSLPLGRVLVSFNAIDEQVIDQALQAQTAIRKGGLDRQDAIFTLGTMVKPSTETAHLKIGELLRTAGILTAAQISQALTTAKTERKLVGEILIETEQVSEEVIATSLCLQALMDAHLIDSQAASGLIAQVAEAIKSRSGEPIASANPMTLFDFMRAAGYLDEGKLARLINECAGFADGASQSKATTSATSATAATSAKSSAAGRTRDAMAEIPRNSEELRKTLLKAFPQDRQVINSGLVIFELVKSGKLLVNQGLVVFGFRQHDLKLAG